MKTIKALECSEYSHLVPVEAAFEVVVVSIAGVVRYRLILCERHARGRGLFATTK